MSSFGQPRTIFRPDGGDYVDGYWVVTSWTQIVISGSLQPATGKDLANLPEGERVRGIFAVYTSSEIRTAEQATASADPGDVADEIEIGGVRYKCIHSEPWQNNVINHYKALFARKD